MFHSQTGIEGEGRGSYSNIMKNRLLCNQSETDHLSVMFKDSVVQFLRVVIYVVLTFGPHPLPACTPKVRHGLAGYTSTFELHSLGHQPELVPLGVSC